MLSLLFYGSYHTSEQKGNLFFAVELCKNNIAPCKESPAMVRLFIVSVSWTKQCHSLSSHTLPVRAEQISKLLQLGSMDTGPKWMTGIP